MRLVIAALASHTSAENGASAALLLPACRLYLQNPDRGQRLCLKRGVCIRAVETMLRPRTARKLISPSLRQVRSKFIQARKSHTMAGAQTS